MDLESVAKELKMLAGREGLTAPELDRAKNLMAQLKGTGMANPEIVELTGGRWSESTTKGYTRGVRATDPEPWKSIVPRYFSLNPGKVPRHYSARCCPKTSPSLM